ncbi:hypothetical protein [Tenacibaculum halocynthiae]|uniref:hypothetical protein n=1 Tax=Tenacibaculum halocynthiae TaxID=1254437 RepID=UPI003894EC4C
MNNYRFNKVDLYKATNGGLEIIHKYIPESEGCEVSTKHKFKSSLIREEKSASSVLFNTGNNWVVKDFGGESYDPISLVMKITGLPFYDAIKRLYSEFNTAANEVVYSANTDFKENKENLPKNYFKIVTKELKNTSSFGRFVTPEIASLYNVFEIDYYQKVTTKEGKLMTVKSTENYPIFCYSNDIEKWAKTYKPLEYKKQNKEGKTVNFKHGYLGSKDDEYILGLDRILNEVEEDQIIKLHELLYKAENKTEREALQKELEELQVKNIIICSGGSDGLNVASLSNEFYPIWLNSEGAQLSYNQYQRINKLCKNFYNLPDVDSAGKKYAHKLSNKYWNLKTIWLPVSKLGEKGKDFRDWLKYYSKADKEAIVRQFKNLLKVALKCNFFDKNDQNRPKINLANFHYFLNTNNYYSYKSNISFQEKTNEDTSYLVKLDGYKVSVPEASEIRSFCIDYIKEKGVDLEKINLIKRSRSFTPNELKTIDRIALDFSSYTEKSQLFYFNNGIVNVSANTIAFSTQNANNNHVWSHKIVQNNFTKKDSFFEYYKDANGNDRVKILNTSCDYMAYLINGSRVFWRKEIEEAFNTKEDQENYRKANPFTLNGSSLTEEEQITQEKHFLNKCFAIGYLLHKYKREDFAKFIYIMDDTVKISDDDANGGTGKSLMVRGLKEVSNIFTIDGKNKSLDKDNHLLGGLQSEHDLISIEDGAKSLGFDFFYNKVTGEIDVNPKNRQGFTISYKDAPKFVGTFNYGLNKNRGSDLRRLFFVSFGDYYHSLTDKFKQERKVSDDFGYSLFQDWNSDKWNNFYNFLIQCCQLYLSNIHNEFKAPMDNITRNNLKAQIGDNCIEWAEDYFSEEDSFNKNIRKQELYDAYKESVGNKSALGIGKFKKAMDKYCKLNGYVFNPKEYRNSQGRIMVNVSIPGTQKRTKKECFYIRRDFEETQKTQENAISNIDTDGVEF